MNVKINFEMCVKKLWLILWCLLGALFIVMCGNMKDLIVMEFDYLISESFVFSFGLIFDSLSIGFVGCIMLISGSVFVYSIWYMDNEVFFKRFIFLVYLFVLSMMFMIMTCNLVSLLIGWDGLGLTSFLLVCYYQNNKSLSGAMLTALSNRVGDVFILFSICFFMNEGGWSLYSYNSMMYMFYFCLIILFAGMTKSAQMPFVAWLPAAMAAPTPVSSLVHSSTLVTAGVYLVLRSYGCLVHSPVSFLILKFLSIITLVLAGSSALSVVDLKKVVALSTLSQLSVMMFSISIMLPFISFFHLVTHAVFKALLFLSAGCFIHSLLNCQDYRMIGSGWKLVPFTSVAMICANMSLCGVPFMSGFFSKDLIIEMSVMGGDVFFIYFMELLGFFFSSWYSMRIMMNVIFGESFYFVKHTKWSEPFELKFSYFFLLCGAVMVGAVMKSKVVCFNEIAMIMNVDFVFFLFFWLYGLSAFFISLFIVSHFYKTMKINEFLGSVWWMENLSSQPFSYGVMNLSDSLVKVLDKGWLEFLGPQGLFYFGSLLSKHNQYNQSLFFLYSVSVMMIFVICCCMVMKILL
uniref:NADH-ubiquinone oxidoreductase chain 5 n=1 Tax=Septifer bilocularis TaxID=102393 RepID=A0A516EZL4_9BIVA|nr:NADH dehydrogenase subunit 5 [Septifer bilocularis]QDO71939.1 NADH dehydrogenase subunit 5 [Septifer bilocularis]